MPTSASPSDGSEKPRKYANVKVEVDGRTFDSKKEARRYLALKAEQRAGLIRGLHPKPPGIRLRINGVTVCFYRPDFIYIRGGKRVVEDVKGDSDFHRTPVYRLKKRLMKAIHGIEIKET